MQTISRRALANFAADELAAGKSHDEVAVKLAAVLIQTKRTSQISQLTEDIAFQLESRRIVATAQVSAAGKISGDLATLVEKFVGEQTGVQKVELEQNIDPGLVGGIMIETAKYKWDQTIKRKLTDILEAF